MESASTVVTEETPSHLESNTKPGRTPLPKIQIGIVLFLQICEPLTSQSIYPYINQLIRELGVTGGDEKKVGYYSGMIESLFFAAEALTVLQWSRLSDHVGRKPILISGLLGTTLSMLSFGGSKTFWALIVTRCLTGLLNGNIGVMKSLMGELTDSTNRAEGFALMPVVWATGATLGPLMGGSLSRPHERFPKLFGTSFWRRYPYFLPCLATSSFVLLAVIIAFFFFKETLKKPTWRRRPPPESSELALSDSEKRADEPLPLRKLLIYPVIISISNYVFLAFLNICANALIPLFFAMSIEIGGLGLSPPTIGITMGVYGAGCGIFQGLFFARLVRFFGERAIYIFGVLMFVPIFGLFPAISLLAKKNGVDSIVWFLVVLLLAMMSLMDMSYGCIAIYVNASAPNKGSLGATNGLSQTTASIARAVGPVMATSLFSWSVQRNILAGYGAYAFFVVLSFGAIGLATRLPAKVWEQQDEGTADMSAST